MSLDELISRLEAAIAELRPVSAGEYVYAAHTNVFVDWLSDALAACKELYERFKERTGRTLPNVESWLNMTEVRIDLMRKVKYGDYVFPRDHNLVVDAMKPLELALREMEDSL